MSCLFKDFKEDRMMYKARRGILFTFFLGHKKTTRKKKNGIIKVIRIPASFVMLNVRMGIFRLSILEFVLIKDSYVHF